MLVQYGGNCIIDSYQDHEYLSALRKHYGLLRSEGSPKIGAAIKHFEHYLNKGTVWELQKFSSIS